MEAFHASCEAGLIPLGVSSHSSGTELLTKRTDCYTVSPYHIFLFLHSPAYLPSFPPYYDAA